MGLGLHWEVKAITLNNSVPVSTKFSFNPGQPDLLIPRSLRADLESALSSVIRVSRDGRMMLTDISAPVAVSIRLLHTEPLELQVRGSGCSTVIRFDDRIRSTAVVAGRVLTRLFGEIVMDFRTGALLIRAGPLPSQRKDTGIVRPLIPMFSRPRIQEIGAGNEIRFNPLPSDSVDFRRGLIAIGPAFRGVTLMRFFEWSTPM